MMKTYEEMAHDALGLISRCEAERKNRLKSIGRIAVPAVSLCLTAALIFGVGQARPAPVTDAGDTDIDGSFYSPEGAAVSSGEVSEQDIFDVETDDGTVEGFCVFWWRNKLGMYGDLYWAIENDPDGEFDVLAVYRPTAGNITSFSYEGKTLAEWAFAMYDEQMLPEKMKQLLKEGDALKYGEALYSGGTPNGEKWAKSLYDERIEFYGEELLNKYIVNGEFLRDDLEKDIAALPSINMTTPAGTTTTTYNSEDSARKKYALAYSAYMEAVLPAAAAKLTESGIKCERAAYMNNGLTFRATADQLENLPLEDIGSWYFSLDTGDLKSSSDDVASDDVATDTAGLQVVN